MATQAADAETTQGEVVLRRLGADAGVSGAMERLIAYRNDYHPASNPRHWAVVNFDLHSAKPRLFVFDRRDEQVEFFLCAHGKGSEGHKDDGYAEVFSNLDGSNCTCLGVFRTGQTYHGEPGHSLYLHGLEPTNFNAMHRHIVMHAADYVSDEFVEKYGRIGRSLGCPAVNPVHSRRIIDKLQNGSFLIHWKTPA